MTTLTWITPAGFLTTITELVSTITSVVASGTNVQYTLISGKLPGGLSISNTGTISGTPNAVIDTVQSKFVVRAHNTTDIIDRTFSITVQGADNPMWTTYTITTGTTPGTIVSSTTIGYLPLGINGAIYAMNNQWIDYQLSATPQQSPENTVLNYYMATSGGKMPPNLRLTTDGKIQGYLNYFTDAGDITTSTNSTITFYLPKEYEFQIYVSDGVSNQSRTFKLLAVDATMFNATTSQYASGIPILTIPAVTTGSSYLQPVQFISGTELGIVRAENNKIISVQAYDPAPLIGAVTYSLTTGTSIYTQLPEYLKLNSKLGYIHGYIPYQPAYTRSYQLTINATKFDSLTGYSITATNTFTLAVRGLVETSIEWDTASELGSVITGKDSELAIKAHQVNSDYSIKYQKISGELPHGLTLLSDGSISGRADYGSTGTFTFTALASDVYELSSIEREFTVNSIDSSTRYTKIYIRPFLSYDKKQSYSEFINDEFIFETKLIYRPIDINFGVQRELKLMLEFGIEQTSVDKYVAALTTNFYRRKFYFGQIKTAIAKDNHGNIIYELVYADAIDELINDQNISVSSAVYFNETPYYPASIDNMRQKLSNIVLDDASKIDINLDYQPQFMKTPQLGNYNPPGYMRVIPICYALPGKGKAIINRIKLNNFDFKMINFEVDRIVVQETSNYADPQYIIFNNTNIKSSVI